MSTPTIPANPGEATASHQHLRYDVHSTGRESTVKCHGRIVSASAIDLKKVVQPLIEAVGRITVDLTDVEYVDSSGLGVLVSLKISAVKAGYCTLEFINLSPRVQDLLRLTRLTPLFAS